VDELLRENNVTFESVDGVGIGMPSFIHFDKGFVIKTASIPQIHDFSLRDYFREKWGDRVRIIIDNDGNTGALAEFRNGAGRGFEHMVFCLVSTGIGSSFIINKSLFRGTYGWAGESGHTLIKPYDPADIVCGCGNTSCLNSACSGKMIVNYIRKWIADGDETMMSELAGHVESINTEHLNRAYEMGDEMAVRAVEQMAQYMAIWLYNLYITLNINCFVFSGGLLAMGDKLFKRVKQLFEQYNKSDYPVYFYNTELGADTGIIGAMELLFSE
jgi:glucokinase